jgi:hypothetical protein
MRGEIAGRRRLAGGARPGSVLRDRTDVQADRGRRFEELLEAVFAGEQIEHLGGEIAIVARRLGDVVPAPLRRQGQGLQEKGVEAPFPVEIEFPVHAPPFGRSHCTGGLGAGRRRGLGAATCGPAQSEPVSGFR